MKYLVVGLGNPGKEYAFTRHNIGFLIADSLAQNSGATFEAERYGDVALVKHKGRTLHLLKPNTYMNLSGRAVQYWLQKLSLNTEHLLVATDDLALPFGTIRLRGKGSDGGHNGLKSIISSVATEHFARLRFGIDAHFPKGKQAEYVLSPWSAEEQSKLPERIALAEDAVLSFCTLGLSPAMTAYNNK